MNQQVEPAEWEVWVAWAECIKEHKKLKFLPRLKGGVFYGVIVIPLNKKRSSPRIKKNISTKIATNWGNAFSITFVIENNNSFRLLTGSIVYFLFEYSSDICIYTIFSKYYMRKIYYT